MNSNYISESYKNVTFNNRDIFCLKFKTQSFHFSPKACFLHRWGTFQIAA